MKSKERAGLGAPGGRSHHLPLQPGRRLHDGFCRLEPAGGLCACAARRRARPPAGRRDGRAQSARLPPRVPRCQIGLPATDHACDNALNCASSAPSCASSSSRSRARCRFASLLFAMISAITCSGVVARVCHGAHKFVRSACSSRVRASAAARARLALALLARCALALFAVLRLTVVAGLLDGLEEVAAKVEVTREVPTELAELVLLLGLQEGSDGAVHGGRLRSGRAAPRALASSDGMKSSRSAPSADREWPRCVSVCSSPSPESSPADARPDPRSAGVARRGVAAPKCAPLTARWDENKRVLLACAPPRLKAARRPRPSCEERSRARRASARSSPSSVASASPKRRSRMPPALPSCGRRRRAARGRHVRWAVSDDCAAPACTRATASLSASGWPGCASAPRSTYPPSPCVAVSGSRVKAGGGMPMRAAATALRRGRTLYTRRGVVRSEEAARKTSPPPPPPLLAPTQAPPPPPPPPVVPCQQSALTERPRPGRLRACAPGRRTSCGAR